MFTSLQRSAAVLVGLALVTGCGDALQPVTGKVTLDGKPLPNAVVQLQPDGPGGEYAYGTSDDEGLFHIGTPMVDGETHDGAMVGSYKVVVVKRAGEPPVPGVYRAKETTPFACSVPTTGPLVLDLKGASEPPRRGRGPAAQR